MVLADTSIWVEHLRGRCAELRHLLEEDEILCHSFVIGEIACGNIRQRAQVLTLLKALPPATEATNEEVLDFLERRQLMGKGLGFVDLHLLASALLSRATFWTFDKRLAEAAARLGMAAKL